MKAERLYKRQLEKHLFGGEAFMPVDEMLKKISFDQLGIRPAELPYSFYELFYHIWFTQRDIMEYCRDQNYSAPKWPQDYWPKKQAPANPEAWEDLKNAFFEDREKLRGLLAFDEMDLSGPVPSTKEHTFFREILLVIEHTAYHTGQLLILLRHLGLHTS